MLVVSGRHLYGTTPRDLGIFEDNTKSEKNNITDNTCEGVPRSRLLGSTCLAYH